MTLGEDAADRSVGFRDRLVDEVDDALFEAALPSELNRHGHVTPDEGPARRIDLVEELEEALALDLGQCLTDGDPDDVAMADELEIGLVRILENVRRAA